MSTPMRFSNCMFALCLRNMKDNSSNFKLKEILFIFQQRKIDQIIYFKFYYKNETLRLDTSGPPGRGFLSTAIAVGANSS